MLDAAESIRIATSLGSIGASVVKDQLSNVIPGNAYWVDSNGTGAGASSSHPGNFDQSFSTLTYAISRCTASKGDVIFVKPGHVETTTAIALNKAGVKIVGLGYGNNRPTFTATTAATDLINVTGANCHIENIILTGAASGVTALLDIGAADFTGRNIRFNHAATPLVAVTVLVSSHRFRLEDCQWYGTAAGPDFCITLEGRCNDWAIIRPWAHYANSSGLDNAFLNSSFKQAGYLIEDLRLVSFDALVIDLNSSVAAVGDGLMVGARCVGSGALTIANVNDVGGMAGIDNQYTDSVAADGTFIPAATAD